MKDLNMDDTFLARWIEGSLSEQELAAFKLHPDYETYLQIEKATKGLQLKTYDTSKALEQLHDRIQTQPSSKVVPLFSLRNIMAVAASILVLIGLFIFTNGKVVINGDSNQVVAQLPDGSEVRLNTNSEISYNKYLWNFQRKLNLNGEAYFSVEKGDKFSVITDNGSVQVLGTQFNVRSLKDYMEVICYEGKVAVLPGTGERTFLNPGEGIQNYNKTQLAISAKGKQQPTWLNGNSSFDNIPIAYVLEHLEYQYGITFDIQREISLDQKYTGTLPNSALNIALQTVFKTLDMEYKLTADSKTVVVK